jgi:hypothetical protein
LLQNRIYLGEVVHKGISYPGEHERIIDDELWSAVEARLLANRGAQRRSRLETGSLITGLIFDHRGNLMSPSYSVRRGKRYRYYVSRGLVRDARKEDAGSHCRVGAEDVERQVVEVLAQQLSRPRAVERGSLRHLERCNPNARSRAHRASRSRSARSSNHPQVHRKDIDI